MNIIVNDEKYIIEFNYNGISKENVIVRIRTESQNSTIMDAFIVKASMRQAELILLSERRVRIKRAKNIPDLCLN